MKRERRRKRQSKPDRNIGQVHDVEITHLGKSGDGIASVEGTLVYVPLALPGDHLSVQLNEKRGVGYGATAVGDGHRVPRRNADCRHFGTCGGCRLQHLPSSDYRDWKRDQILKALRSQGIDCDSCRSLTQGRPATRRRLRLAFANQDRRTVLGFRRRARHEIVQIRECPIALPAIANFFKPLHRVLASLDMAKEGGEVSITKVESGIDLLFDTKTEPSLGDREKLAALAEEEDLARIAWRPDVMSAVEPVAARCDVTVLFGDVLVNLPSGAFLQATDVAERAIVDAVMSAVDGAGRIADFFSGCGAIGLPLARHGQRVQAYERDPAMVRTLNAAARYAGLHMKIQAESRDLDRDPLTGTELAPFDALILDPPRAGARVQVDAIAEHEQPFRLAMVSCNPATFARDSRILIDSGYRLKWVQPVDAFVYSAEIELVAAFDRAKAS